MFSFGYKRNGEGWPIATWSITATTCLIYLISSSDTSVMEVLVGTLGFVPLQFSLHPAANLHRLITAEFLHLDAFHLLGNLIFLVSFGRAVEGALGRLSFAAAFIGLGALSFLGSWLADPASPSPSSATRARSPFCSVATRSYSHRFASDFSSSSNGPLYPHGCSRPSGFADRSFWRFGREKLLQVWRITHTSPASAWAALRRPAGWSSAQILTSVFPV